MNKNRRKIRIALLILALLFYFSVDIIQKLSLRNTDKEGDKVEILYEETGWIDENGIDRTERKAKEIRFISPAVKGLVSQ